MSVELPSMTNNHLHAAIGWRKNKIAEYELDIVQLQNEIERRRAAFQEATKVAMEPKITVESYLLTEVKTITKRLNQLEFELGKRSLIKKPARKRK